MNAPYLRIASELEHRIRSGQIGPGERVPSNRELVREHGIAMATASKVLAELGRRGLVEAIPGVGTVALRAEPTARRREAPVAPAAMRARIVRAAIAIADAEGFAAVSMRRIGVDLGVATMSLYRFVPGREELTLQMIDAAMDTGPWPAPQRGWRDQLEYVGRRQWTIYRAHPWLARAVSFTRPLLAPHAMAHTEWSLRALTGLGFDLITATAFAINLFTQVQGLAANLEAEAAAERETGIDSDEWMETQAARFMSVIATGKFPMLGELAEHDTLDLTLDRLFESGLALLLDGIAATRPRVVTRK